MVDQHPQSTPPAGLADAFVRAAGELAEALRDLASAVRETAAFTQVEFVPCEDGDTDDETGETGGQSAQQHGGVLVDCERIRARDSRDPREVVLPLVPVQDRAKSSESLCAPGGCSCDQPGVGRHARREDAGSDDSPASTVTDMAGGRAGGCCQGLGAGVGAGAR